MSITFQDIKNNREVQTYLQKGNDALGVIGFTEHGFAHARQSANHASAADILQALGYDERTMRRWPAIAGYMHDIGNVVNRDGPRPVRRADGLYRSSSGLGMPPEEIAEVISRHRQSRRGHRRSRSIPSRRRSFCADKMRRAPHPGAQPGPRSTPTSTTGSTTRSTPLR